MSDESPSIRVDAEVRRKAPELPRFLEIPADAVRELEPEGTTPVEVTLGDTPVGRRTLKAWGGDRDVWFINLTAAQCDAAGIDTGDTVEVRVRKASAELPEELADLIERSDGARRAWNALTPGARRMLSEHVRGAKRAETRRRRARRALEEKGEE